MAIPRPRTTLRLELGQHDLLHLAVGLARGGVGSPKPFRGFGV